MPTHRPFSRKEKYHAPGQISQGIAADQAPHRANEACDAERVTVNGRVQRVSYDVKVGDVIAIRFGAKTLTVEVLSVTEHVGKDAAAAMYREV